MSNGIIIVESAHKAETIRTIITDYDVATVEKDRDNIEQLNLHNYPFVYIATDANSAGESYGAKIASMLQVPSKRIVFNEITERSIRKAIDGEEQGFNECSALAFQTRKKLEEIVDADISDVMEFDFRKHRIGMYPKGTTIEIAPALSLIAENHKRIDEYIPDTYEQIAVDYNVNGETFRCFLRDRFNEDSEEAQANIITSLQNHEHKVIKFRQKTREEGPYPPLTIGRLSRSSFYLLGIEPAKTKNIAMELYELGLITNPITSGIDIEAEVIQDIVSALERLVTPEFIFEGERKFKNKTKSKGMAIRPTGFDETMSPEFVRDSFGLNEQQFELYEFIWYRTLSTQMSNAIYDASVVEIKAGDIIFGAQANICMFEGWQSLKGNYLIEAEQADNDYRGLATAIPNMKIEEVIYPIEIAPVLRHTKAPGRYGVGRFVTQLEKFVDNSRINDIIESLVEREYIRVDKGMISILALGLKVDSWTKTRATWLHDVANAVVLKQALEAIAEGDKGVANEMINQYIGLMDELKKEIGFIGREYWPPSRSQHELVLRLAQQNNVAEADIEEVLKYKVQCEAFINKYKRVYETVGECPECKANGRTGEVKDYDNFFGCVNFKKGCGFKLWKNSINKMFTTFKRPQSNDDLFNIIHNALEGNTVVVEDLVSKQGNVFPGKFVIEKENQYWNLKMKFTRKGRH